MLRYNGIIKEDTVNAENGIHTTIFFQGCSHHCEGCYNQDTWDFNGGYEFTKEKQDLFIELCKKPYIDAISLTGGDPLQQNFDDMLIFLKRLKEETGKKIYCWTGYTFKELEGNSLLKYIDVLIDGRFDLNSIETECGLYGSSNQNIIRIKE